MMNENDEILLSQLADGELDSDVANDLLLRFLDDPADREAIRQALRLRQTTAGWRKSQPSRPTLIVSPPRSTPRPRRALWRVGQLAVAACIGGILVLSGFWAAGRFGAGDPSNKFQHHAQATVTADQMQQAAKVFALHESVAGPLAWYAADDKNIRLASAGGTEATRMPIAILLKLQGQSDAPRTLLIVCRDNEPAVIELPAESPGQGGLRLYLTPRSVNGKVDVHYAIAVSGEGKQSAVASVSGQRRVGLAETSLGQLAMGDKTLNVEAAAWPMRERN